MPKKDRKKTPKEIEAQVLAANRHLCCICHEEGRGVQIHHIDGDPSNYDPENLCVLCLPHHDEVEKKSVLTKGYKPDELRIYKETWENHCKLENKKGIVIKNFFIVTDKKPEWITEEIAENFIRDVAASTTLGDIFTTVAGTSNVISESTGDESLGQKFESTVLKEDDDKEDD